MKILSRCIAVTLVLIALFQLYGISERVTNALWMCYKFHCSNGDGITLGTSMTLITYTVSTALIVLSFVVNNKSSDKFTVALTRFSICSLLFGLACLTILLVSSLAYLDPR
jgi:hypothetical protein